MVKWKMQAEATSMAAWRSAARRPCHQRLYDLRDVRMLGGFDDWCVLWVKGRGWLGWAEAASSGGDLRSEAEAPKAGMAGRPRFDSPLLVLNPAFRCRAWTWTWTRAWPPLLKGWRLKAKPAVDWASKGAGLLLSSGHYPPTLGVSRLPCPSPLPI